MARDRKVQQKKKTVPHALPLTKTNYQILGAGLVVIALGYVALGQQPWDGFMALTAAPVLLVLGYCVIVPLGILYRKRENRQRRHSSKTRGPLREFLNILPSFAKFEDGRVLRGESLRTGTEGA